MTETIDFTKANLSALEPAKTGKRDYYLDGHKRAAMLQGFGLVVNDKGSKHFILTQYFKRDRNTVRLRCGEYPNVTIEQARIKARDYQNMLIAGIHPTEKRQQARADRLSLQSEQVSRNVTLAEVLENYLEHRNLKPGTVNDYRKTIDETWHDWIDRPMLNINEDVVREQHRIRTKTSPSRANNAMRVLRALFNFARIEYRMPDGTRIFPDNPVSILSESRSWNRVYRRKTYIRIAELPDWFEAVDSLQNTTVRDYFMFLLFTGARAMEAAALSTSDIDFRSRTFTLRDTKNGEDVTLPMSDYVVNLLQDRTGQWVFPSIATDGHIMDTRWQQAIVTEQSGVPFTPHDLRRTFMTYGESLDISTYAVKRLVNHRSGEQSDVTLGYIGLDIERLRKATQRITSFILANSRHEQSKVVPLHGR